MKKADIKEKLLKVRDFLLNPHLVICFTAAWIITNGWAYLALVLGGRLGIKWLTIVAGTYLAILWSPLCAEGRVTCIIAVFLLRIVFPDDDKTVAELKKMSEKAKSHVHHFKKLNKKKKTALAEHGENTEDN